MRDQGQLTNWDDDKGFGFVTPDDGGLRAFVHIRAFSYRHRRPRNGDVITYQLAWDPKGRPRAENVLFQGAPVVDRPARDHRMSRAPRPSRTFRRPREPASTSNGASYTFCTVFLVSVVVLAAFGKLPWLVPLIYVVVSLLLFCIYAFDKSAAMNDRWRTTENTLQVMALFGGWPGALVAQRLFHHKSKKRSFQSAFWGIVIIHVVGVTLIAFNFPFLSALTKLGASLSS